MIRILRSLTEMDFSSLLLLLGAPRSLQMTTALSSSSASSSSSVDDNGYEVQVDGALCVFVGHDKTNSQCGN